MYIAGGKINQLTSEMLSVDMSCCECNDLTASFVFIFIKPSGKKNRHFVNDNVKLKIVPSTAIESRHLFTNL